MKQSRPLRIYHAAQSTRANDPAHLPTFPPSHRTRRAFTLLEVMAVAVLLGIAATIVSLRLESTTSDARLKAASTEIEQMFHMGTQEARTRKRAVDLAFDIDNARFRMERGNESEQDVRDWRLLEGTEIAALQIGVNHHASGIVRIRITPAGVALPWEIVLAKGRRQLSLRCNGITGEFSREWKEGKAP